ncbi:carbohydrate sulfotransferase 14-like, partial [Lingula anatina]|uniref:Carbohydrate sulfotransferase n=1 Tax=Lingula anatina TaxID=7574 RepID=A0A1S3JFC2_LINAN
SETTVSTDEKDAQMVPRMNAVSQEESTETVWEAELERRKNLIMDVCKKHGMSLDWRPNPSRQKYIVVEEKSKVMACLVPIPKSGLSGWKRWLLAIGGYMNGTMLQDIAISKKLQAELSVKHLKSMPASTPEQLTAYYKVFFIGDPLERLLSVYKNKIETNHFNNLEVVSVVGNYVLENYRGETAKLPVTIKREIGKAVCTLPNGQTVEYYQRDNKDLISLSFDDFLNYVVDNPDKMDLSWQPLHEICQPCGIKYDVVGYFSSLLTDNDNIIKHLKVDPTIKFPDYLYDSSEKIMDEYYSKVSKQVLNRIKQMYETDGQMAGTVPLESEVQGNAANNSAATNDTDASQYVNPIPPPEEEFI